MAETEGDKIHTNNSSEQDFDHMFKILIIGNTAVGKTSLLLRYTEDSFTSAFVNTVGIDFKVRTVSHNGKTIKLHMWDTAGNPPYCTELASSFEFYHFLCLAHHGQETFMTLDQRAQFQVTPLTTSFFRRLEIECLSVRSYMNLNQGSAKVLFIMMCITFSSSYTFQ